MKTCTLCKESKSYEMFSPDPMKKDGYRSGCRKCNNLRTRKRRENDDVRLQNLAAMRKVRAQNPEKYRSLTKDSVQKWQEKNPHKRKASQKVNNAIRDGRLTREACEVCGDKNSHGHHDSYEESQWLNVRWLCKTHHYEHHRMMSSAAVALDPKTV
jgi:hypothetical protein